MEDYSYMCGECFQFCDNIDNFIHHVCLSNVDSANTQEIKVDLQKRGDKSKITCLDPGTSVSATIDSGGAQNVNEKISKDDTKTTEGYLSTGQEYSDLEVTEDEDITAEGGGGKKRKKYQAMADEYRVNRIMRDKDFKLGRTHLYSFKDTLGDWDERSTKLLIHLIQKYPKSHFLLPTRSERRLGYWENIHQEMETAGYTFTVLQLRMRWREVLQKYRWTVDYNDDHEIKKKCEYFDEMIELFGDWDKEATQCLLKQMHQLSLENQKKKILRIGYVGWERITSSLNNEGHRFTIDMVEARWRNMVTLYKTMVDHNALPNVEPHIVAYKGDLEKILNYVPKRRKIYEKVKGRSVKMERFPTNGIKVLLQAYKDCINQFVDLKTKNTMVWDEIKQKLEEDGYEYSTLKLKEILNGIIKGYEKTQLHNSLPGAIRRDVPYYRELSEIYGAHGRWPHIQTSRTKDMRNKRKFRLRLQASQQLWSSEESKALLEIYPDVLEAHVNQNVSHQASDLWLQVAKAYTASGFPKRDVPEIAVHIGLLRMGYAQQNSFPFLEEMRKVKETEEAVCYSPDVSKFTGDVEVIYWSHEAVICLLELYLKHQASVTCHSSKEEVFMKIREDMQNLGYGYTKDQINGHFRTLMTQYRTRTSKVWHETESSRKTSNPTGAPYLGMLEKVCQLRRKLSLSWTSGVMPLNEEAVNVVYKVACKKAEELFLDSVCPDEKKMIPLLIEQIQSYIRTKKLLEDVPRTRQIRLHLVCALRRFHEGKEENSYITKLHEVLKANSMDNFFTSLKKQDVPVLSSRSLKRQREHQASRKSTGKKQGLLEYDGPLSDSDSSDTLYRSAASHNKSTPLLSHLRNCDVDDTGMGKSTVCKGDKHENVPDIQKPNKENVMGKCVRGTPSRFTDVHSTSKDNGDVGVSSANELSVEIQADGYIIEKCYTKSNPESKVSSHTGNFEKPGELKNRINPNLQTLSCETGEVIGKIPGNFKHEKIVPVSGECSLSGQSSKMECGESQSWEERGNTKCLIPSASGSDIAAIDTVIPHCLKSKTYPESLCGKIRTEAETRVIHTRSGRKTRFTFFSDSLDDNFEDEDQTNRRDSASAYESFPGKIEQKNKSIQNDVNMPGKRKRGRPRKNQDSSSVVHFGEGNGSDSLMANAHAVKKSLTSSAESTGKQTQENVYKQSRQTISVVYCNEVNDGMCLKGSASATDMDDRLGTKLYDGTLQNCGLSSVVIAALERHQVERIEKENTLFDILERHRAQESIVVNQMLDMFRNLKGILNTRIKS